ncbi:MAG: ATP-binding protein, partial [Opitutales bacterium]|nr:ATP-binding protein [Opitutales bacterium]
MENISKNNAEFSFGWLALKLLGKSLYSNAWSAISELVANGFDANANNVFVFIDSRNKKTSLVEIFDDGNGMDKDDILTYVKVGNNKREDYKKKHGEYPNSNVMGRKGIGKLAALYLSERYYIVTKKNDDLSCWKMEYNEDQLDNDKKPSLVFIDNKSIPFKINKKFEALTTGTLIRMENVNLSGLAEQAFNALPVKLANQFALECMDSSIRKGKQIFLCVKSSDEILDDNFVSVKKEIAFKNMAFIQYCLDGYPRLKSEIESKNGSTFLIPYPPAELNGENVSKQVEIKPFLESQDIKLTGQYPNESENSRPYKLEGWIGIHSSINSKIAGTNDSLFKKNQFYNP